MSSTNHPVLQKLHRLDRSLPEFHTQLSKALYGDEYQRCVPNLQTIGREPFTSGGYGDVYEGTLDGARVCVKRLRAYTKDGPQKAIKARSTAFSFSLSRR